MILHVATFELRSDASAEQIAGLTAALEAMAASLPQLRLYRCGENLRLRPGGADFGVIAAVDDAAGLEAYLSGPEHAEVAEEWLSWIVTGRHAVQLEMDPVALDGLADATRR